MSDHWVKKMKTYFQRIDFDKDGSITRADFEGMAARFIEHGKKNSQFDDAKSKDMETTLTAVWDKYLSSVSGGAGITQDKFIEGLQKQVKDPAMKSAFEGPLPLFFHAVDTDNDGQISAEEYKNFYTILGLDVGLAAAAFKAIDTDNDGQLSCKEFVDAGTAFFTSEDPACPTANFWGPLL